MNSKNKITFVRTDSHKKKRLASGWRRPKGLQNKRRLMKRGFAPVVKVGYGSSNKTKDTVKGLEPIKITNVEQLSSLNKKTQGALVARTLGGKNKLEILIKAKELGLTVLNHDVDKKVNRLNDSINQRKEKKSASLKAKEQKEKEKKDAEKKAKKKEEESKKKSETKKESAKPVEEKEADKKELDKLLTKKQ